ncbi:MAG: hypothetical protein ACTSPG_07140 [Candidatus Hodarchaeales archaeon]
MARKKKPVCPQIAFFIVNHGIPTVSIGFPSEQSLLFGGILTAISQITQSETGMGQLDDIQAQNGRIYIQNMGQDSLVGFFVWSRTGFPQHINRQMKVLAGALGSRYLSDYLFNPAFEEILMVGALPEKFQVYLAYQSIASWRKQLKESPFKLTDTLEKRLEKIDSSIFKELGLKLADLTFPEKIENAIDQAVWRALGLALGKDISPLITARNIDKIILNLRSRIKELMSDEIRHKGPARILRDSLQQVEFTWPQ